MPIARPTARPLPPIRWLTLLLGLALALTTMISMPAPARADTVSTVDDAVLSGPSSWSYQGSWIAGKGLNTTNWQNGTEHYANAVAGSTVSAKLTFSGTRAVLYGIKAPTHGIYAMSVDGGAERTVDAYAATRQFRQPLFDTGVLSNGSHLVTLRLTGQRNAAATGAYANLDYASVTVPDAPATPATLTWQALPQPTSLTVSSGSWKPTASTRVVVGASDWPALQAEATRLSAELGTLAGQTGPAIAVGATPTAADVVLGLSGATTGPESYSLTASATGVTVLGGSDAGVFYGTRQIVQNLRAQKALPLVQATSSPAVVERSLHIDIARKYYTKEWVAQQIRTMADQGLNTLQLHFSEREGFRIESSVPGVSSAQRLSKADVRSLIDLAHAQHIDVIPSLDLPGHLTQALSSYPQYRLKTSTGTTADALDITNPAAVAWATQLVDEFAAVFYDSKYWNLGGDEFVDFGKMSNYPSLASYAKTRYNNQSANGFDALNGFVNDMADHLQAKGYRVRVWNDGMWRGAVSTIDADIQIDWWTNWSSGMKPVSTGVSKGHTMINFNDSVMYYVLGQAAGYTYPTAQKFFDRGWHPGMFPGLPGGATQTYNQPYPSWLRGASFAIWSDVPSAQTETQVTDGIRGPLRAMAERSWNAGSKLSYAQFSAVNTAIGTNVAAPTASPGPISGV